MVNRVPLRLGKENDSKEERSVNTLVIRKEVEMWTDAGETSVDLNDQVCRFHLSTVSLSLTMGFQHSLKSEVSRRASIGSTDA